VTIGPPRVQVTGLFTEPRPVPTAVSRPLGEALPSPFRPVDGVSTVIYDVESMKETDLGPGNRGLFNADSSYMVWLSGSAGQTLDAMLLNLRTMERQSLGQAEAACWKDGGTVALRPPGAEGAGGPGTLADVATGARTETDFVSCAERFDLTTTPDGYELRQQYSSLDGPVPPSNWYLTDPSSGDLLLKFEAYQVVPAGRGWLAVATVIEETGPPNDAGFRPGTTNVFLIEIATGKATFIATSPWFYANWPLVANERFVAWTDAYCAQPQGTTKLYDRTTGQIVDLGQPLWLDDFTDDGLLAVGAFGAKALIDLEVPAYRVVLPGGEPRWSPDWRYASVGLASGHGGLCP
jgi:hypothetical protein